MEKKIQKEIIDLFKNSNNIAVFTGAGISTNCGIPDFRGPNGLYSFVQQKYNLPYPESIFDINYFHINPEPFFDLSKELFSEEIRPSTTHKFLAWLEEKNKISFIMTQNIDMLHQKAGSKKVIECHGSYLTAHCTSCSKKYNIEQFESSIKEGKIPHCSCSGIIKPDVVFFGEQLPEDFYNIYQKPPETDLLIAMGTSLTVQPAAGFALSLVRTNPSILVNLETTEYDQWFTYTVHDDLDDFSKIIWDELRN